MFMADSGCSSYHFSVWLWNALMYPLSFQVMISVFVVCIFSAATVQALAETWCWAVVPVWQSCPEVWSGQNHRQHSAVPGCYSLLNDRHASGKIVSSFELLCRCSKQIIILSLYSHLNILAKCPDPSLVVGVLFESVASSQCYQSHHDLKHCSVLAQLDGDSRLFFHIGTSKYMYMKSFPVAAWDEVYLTEVCYFSFLCVHLFLQGFGVAAKSTLECRKADPGTLVAFHQADIGEYLRSEDTLTWVISFAAHVQLSISRKHQNLLLAILHHK